MRHVVFRLDRDLYALPLSSIREVVVAPTAFTRVPRAPPLVRGVINLRGRVVPVIDLKRLLALRGPDTRPLSRIVLLDRGRRELGLLITDVDGIDHIENVTSSSRSSGTVRGLARLGALAVTVLDADGIDAAISSGFAAANVALAPLTR